MVVAQQYLSYLRTMSETEHMSRACLQAEWAFTARLARRVRCAARLAPLTFSSVHYSFSLYLSLSLTCTRYPIS
jgi:hypothetical protein